MQIVGESLVYGIWCLGPGVWSTERVQIRCWNLLFFLMRKAHTALESARRGQERDQVQRDRYLTYQLTRLPASGGLHIKWTYHLRLFLSQRVAVKGWLRSYPADQPYP